AAYFSAIRAAERVGERQNKAAVMAKLGMLSTRRGNVEQARERFADARDVAVDAGDPRIEVNARLGLARAYRLTGQFQEAKTELLRALPRASVLASQPQLADVLLELTRVEIVIGDTTTAARPANALRRLDLDDAHKSEFAAQIVELGPIPETDLSFDEIL